MKEVVQIQDLISNVHQPDRNGTEKLADSMMAIGQVTPIVVVPSGDKFIIVAGHRRVEAAKSLGWTEIEAVVHEGDETAQVAALAADNLQRKDFTEMQIGMLVQTLFDLGASEEMVADVTGFKPKSLKVAAAIYEKSKESPLAEGLMHMNLEEANTYLKVQLHPELTKELDKAIGTEQWAHTASRVKKKAQEIDAIAKVEAQLTKEGCPIVAQPSWSDEMQIRLSNLGIEPKEHKKCAGHAAYISTDWQSKAEAVYLCLAAPEHHGYKPTKSTGGQDEKQKEQSAKGREFRKAMLPATEVRREFIVGRVKQIGKMKGRHQFLVEHFVTSRHGTRTDAMFALLMGIKLPKDFDRYYTVTKEQLARIGQAKREQELYAAVIAWCEEELRLCQGPEGDTTYRIGEVQPYLKFLAANGYVLSPEEQQIMDWVDPRCGD